MTFVAGCDLAGEKTNLSTENPIHLSVSAFVGDMTDGTRVTFNPEDSTKLIWEGDESIAIMIGDNNSKTGSPATYSNQELQTVAGKKGVFEGTVNLGSWTTDNIKGIVYPYTEHAWIRYNNNLRIVTRIGSEPQIQKYNNVLNGKYAPLFAEVSLEDFTVDGSKYSIEDKELRWSCSMFRYNIYGQHPQMNANEIFKSITITCVSSWHLAGTYEWQIGQNKAVYNGIASFIETQLQEECTIADKTQATGIKVFGVLLPRNTTFIGLKVVTDKATYTKTINYTSTTLNTPGTVQPINVDLATFDSRIASSAEPYSIDGGNTWSATKPTASDNFTSLIVKGAELTLDDLNDLATAINGQAETVALDLSQSTYATGIWPTSVFTAADATAGANIKLKSIKFPSNILAIDASAFAYNGNLKEVCLDGIQEIGNTAFRNTHLETLVVPKSITKLGGQVWRWNFYLDSVYYNSPAPSASVGTYPLAQNDATMNDNPENKKEVIVFGPDVIEIPQYCMRSNALLNKVVFEGNPKWNIQMFSNSKNLTTIICKSTTPPAFLDGVTSCCNTSTGANIAEGDKKIFVPSGCKAAYEAAAPIAELISKGKFVVVEAD